LPAGVLGERFMWCTEAIGKKKGGGPEGTLPRDSDKIRKKQTNSMSLMVRRKQDQADRPDLVPFRGRRHTCSSIGKKGTGRLPATRGREERKEPTGGAATELGRRPRKVQ